ncbi:unnamed protein product [Ranitomeya imitator]|uniref:Uncharacterized protein n=1 Tax=Ranitomeya imitator TaxID=111125 RepID=A0ABN9L6F7_9NEOB|nr:unnamed protein product [Ranitomeya imitator]
MAMLNGQSLGINTPGKAGSGDRVLAWEYGIPFYETSAKENINIENAFHMLSEAIYSKRSSVLINQNIVNLRELKKSSSCGYGAHIAIYYYIM